VTTQPVMIPSYSLWGHIKNYIYDLQRRRDELCGPVPRYQAVPVPPHRWKRMLMAHLDGGDPGLKGLYRLAEPADPNTTPWTKEKRDNLARVIGSQRRDLTNLEEEIDRKFAEFLGRV